MGSCSKRIRKNSEQYYTLIGKLNEKLNEAQAKIDPEKTVDLAEQVRKEIAGSGDQRRKQRNKRKAAKNK